MPASGELPRVGRSVVPLMRSRDTLVCELVADGCPCLTAVIGTLDQLAEPCAALRSVQTIGLDRRSLEVIDLPARKVRPVDVPPLALPIRSQHECAFSRADEHTYRTHPARRCEPYRSAARALAFSASSSRVFGGAFVSRE